MTTQNWLRGLWRAVKEAAVILLMAKRVETRDEKFRVTMTRRAKHTGNGEDFLEELWHYRHPDGSMHYSVLD